MSLEVIAGALQMDVAEAERILGEGQPAVQERAGGTCRFVVCCGIYPVVLEE